MNNKIIVLALCSLLLAPCSCRRRAAARKNLSHRFPGYQALLPVARCLLEAFRQELSKLGWIEGKNITIEYRFAEQKLSVCLSLRRTWFVLRLI